jgi:hypothetical protein
MMLVRTRMCAGTNRKFIFQLEFRDRNKIASTPNTKASHEMRKNSYIRLMPMLMYEFFSKQHESFPVPITSNCLSLQASFSIGLKRPCVLLPEGISRKKHEVMKQWFPHVKLLVSLIHCS